MRALGQEIADGKMVVRNLVAIYPSAVAVMAAVVDVEMPYFPY